jgi:HAD superfamily hydrolase (TIGR01549 family)
MSPSPLRVIFFDLGETLVTTTDRRWVAGAKEVLAALRARDIQLGVISNTGNLTREQLGSRLPADFDWAWFDSSLVILSSEVGAEKPSPEIFNLAATSAGGAANCLFCTEDLADTIAAQQVGMFVARLESPPRSDLRNLEKALMRGGLIGAAATAAAAPTNLEFDVSQPSPLIPPSAQETISMARKTEDLSAAVQQLSDLANSLTSSATTIMEAMKALADSLAHHPPTGDAGTASPAGTLINAWEDDPFSEKDATTNPPLAQPIQVPVPVNLQANLPFRITDSSAPTGLFAPGTAQFRFWEATEALTRGINYWGPLLPASTKWSSVATPLNVRLNAGIDLNANYSRQFGLSFFQARVAGKHLFSAESPDVSCHELGHGLLDALKPQLFNTASAEVAAFHEAVGDMSAILCALQIPSLRTKALAETNNRLNVNSRLSRLAEQLGWAIRQVSPTAVDRDCLRNAANRFVYQAPNTLPSSAPAIQLSSEVHSFARVFTGAFLDALARMFALGPATSANLLNVSRDMGQLLVNGVRLARVTSRYYSQVAAGMIQAGATLFANRYKDALLSGFMQHGIISPSTSIALDDAPVPSMGLVGGRNLPTYGDDDGGFALAGTNVPEMPLQSISMMGMSIQVHAPTESPRYGVAPVSFGLTDAAAPQDEAAAFVEHLIQRGQLKMEPGRGNIVSSDRSDGRVDNKVTHTLEEGTDGRMRLKRLHFLCGCCRHAHD